jgi:hypothetical protein
MGLVQGMAQVERRIFGVAVRGQPKLSVAGAIDCLHNEH